MLVPLESDPVLTQIQANCGTALKLLDWTDTLPTQVLQSLLNFILSLAGLYYAQVSPSTKHPQIWRIKIHSPSTMEEVGFNDRQFAIQYILN